MTPIADLLVEVQADAGVDASGRSLVLRQWADPSTPVGRSDVEALVAAWRDREITRWNPPPPDPSVEFAERWIRQTGDQHTESRSIDVVLAMPDGELVGEVGLLVDHDRRLAELGFWVAANHRRHGHGSTLISLGVELAWMLELRRLVAVVDVENLAATALLQKADWSEVATTTPVKRAFARTGPAPQ